MGRGFAIPPAKLSLLLLFGAGILQIYSCNFSTLSPFDVPPCSGVASCAKATGLLDVEPSYARAVGAAWYHSNRTMGIYESARSYCEGDFNISDLSGLISSAASAFADPASDALKYSNESVNYVVRRAGRVADDLAFGGVEYVPYSDWRDLYDTAVDVIRASEGNAPNTGLGKAISRYRSTQYAIRNALSVLGIHMAQVVLYAGKWGTVFVPQLSKPILSSAASAYDLIFQKFGPDATVNAAVGLHDSVYKLATPFLRRYRAVEGAYNEGAESMIDEARRTRDEIVSLSIELERRASSEITADLLAVLPASSSVRSTVTGMPSDLPAISRIRSAALLRAIENNAYRFMHRDANFLVDYMYAERSLDELRGIKTDLERYNASFDALARSCQGIISKYRPRSEYVKSILPGYVSALKSNPDLALCLEGLRLVAMDKNYARDEEILASCESRISCGSALPEEYPCIGSDLHSRISCCLNYEKRKRSEILSSDLYAQYLRLRSSIEALLSLHDDPALRAEYLSLPTSFVCESDLAKAVSEATKIYLALRKEVSRYAHPLVVVHGYLDGKSVSRVSITFKLDVGGADLLVTQDLPFQIIAFRTIDSKGLWVNTTGDGRRVVLKGSGSARIDAEVMPVDLEIDDWGADMGYRYLRIRNPIPYPVRYPISGKLVSASDTVSYDGKYVYFKGVGDAIVSIPAVEVNYAVVRDVATVSVRNSSEFPYDGQIIVPISATKLPRNCKSLGDISVCSVDLDPFSEQIMQFGGVVSEYNLSEDSVPSSVTSFSSSFDVGKADSTISSIDVNGSSALRSEILSRLSELNSLFSRASELNVAYLLPYSAEFISDLHEKVDDTNDYLVLSAYSSVLDGIYADVVSRARALVFSVPPGTDVRSLAERALNSGDYMLAMALAASYKPKKGGTSVPYASIILGLLSLALLVYYLRAQKPRRKKRIPKI